MEFFGLVIAFIVIVGMIMKRVNLGVAMLSGALVIGLSSPNIGFQSFFEILGQGLFDKTTIELILIVINIGLIANLMDKTGLVDRMIAAMSLLFRKFQVVLSLVPSAMGFLPIPGGAMLSAPMVDSIARDLNLSNSKKMGINLLFRHIWYFVFPFSPGLILAAGLTGYEISQLIGHFFPITIALGGIGFVTLFKNLENPPMERAEKDAKIQAIKDLFLIFLPLIVGIVLPYISSIPFWGALTIGLIILIIYKRDKIEFKMVIQSLEWKLSLGILGIMIFREFVNNLDALHQLAQMTIDAGMPIWLLAILLPGMVGFMTGTTSGAVGITFPLLMPLIGGTNPDMGYVTLMFGSAFFAYYISPVHFCLILTAEYFGTNLKETYRELIWPTLAGIGTMAVLFFLY